ncbi:MAG: hypothetical protein Q7U45_14530, partial [Burkholderiaceae bacterium]|nr:hypothetical protein [Burkholderiaceae bacterium]
MTATRVCDWAAWGTLGLATVAPGTVLAAADVLLRLETVLGHTTNALRLANDELARVPPPVT